MPTPSLSAGPFWTELTRTYAVTHERYLHIAHQLPALLIGNQAKCAQAVPYMAIFTSTVTVKPQNDDNMAKSRIK